MSGLTRSQIEAFDPGPLLTFGQAWMKMSSSAEDLFTRYRNAVSSGNGSQWSGVAADAALNRAQSDMKSAQVLADKLESLAQQATRGYWDVNAARDRAVAAINGAESSGYSVSESLQVTDSRTGPYTDAQESARQSHQQAVTDGALGLFNLDTTVANALDAARPDLIATFTSADSIGSEEGKADGKQFADDPLHMSPEAQRRLIEAGKLTPEDLAALKAGQTATVSASQMEYLNTFARQLDGKSPQEIEKLMKQLPPETREGLSNALQVASNPHVSASVSGDPEVPTTGGSAVLPQQMKNSLERKDLVSIASGGQPAGKGGVATGKVATLSGVADNQAIARVIAAGDPAYRQGSDLDIGMLDVSRQYLHAEVVAEQAGMQVKADAPGPITESMFAAVGPDKIAVESAIKEHGGEFVADTLTHRWSDDGAAVASLYSFAPGDAEVTNTHDPVDVQTAKRMGSIMQAVADSTAREGDWQTLSSVPGTGGLSVGQLNPTLLQTVSSSMTPYIPDIVGDDTHPDFHWSSTGTSLPSTHLVAVMNTDPTAADSFNSAIATKQLQYGTEFGHDPRGSVDSIGFAGTLRGISDHGVYLAAQDQYGIHAEQAVWDRKSAVFDRIQGLVTDASGYVPHGDLAQSAANGSDVMKTLKDYILGPRPDDTVVSPEGFLPQPQGPDSAATYYAALVAAGRLSPEAAALGGDFVNPATGMLKPYGEIYTGENGSQVATRLGSMLEELLPGASSQYTGRYNEVTTPTPSASAPTPAPKN